MTPLLETSGFDLPGLFQEAYVNGASVMRKAIPRGSLDILIPDTLHYLSLKSASLRDDYAGPYEQYSPMDFFREEWHEWVRRDIPSEFFTLPRVKDFQTEPQVITLYPKGHRGIGKHTDGSNFYNVIAIFNLMGETDFTALEVEREDHTVFNTTLNVNPGDIVLLRAKGLKDYRGEQAHFAVNTKTPRLMFVSRQFAFIPEYNS